MPAREPASVPKPRIFIGSSSPNLNAARALADGLRGRGFVPLVWDQQLFRQMNSTLDELLRISREEVEFAVFVWGASDVIISNRRSLPAPRDNVVFETGLFLGVLGKQRTFMVVDQTIELKIPTDFQGITRSHYDASLLGTNDIAALDSACNVIDRSIRQRKISDYLLRLQGQWISLFAAGPFLGHPVKTDNIEIIVEENGIFLTGSSGDIPYTGFGRVYNGDQIFGYWKHPPDRSPAHGLFMLVVNATGDAMLGYATSQDARKATIFNAWVFAKNDGGDEQAIRASLMQSLKDLEEGTISPRFERDNLVLPPSWKSKGAPPLRGKA